MLLPDQTYEQCQDILAPLEALRKIIEDSKFEPRLDDGNIYKQNVAIVEKKKNEKLKKLVEINEDEIRSCSPESYGKKSEFFNNIPVYTGEPLGPFSIPNKRTSIRTSADVLKECEEFLYKHRIRPDFFCRYRKAINVSQSAPPSSPLSGSKSPKVQRKPQSASPPRATTSSRMRRFQKSTAIYTLPIRGKRRRSLVSSTASGSLIESHATLLFVFYLIAQQCFLFENFFFKLNVT